MAFETIVTETRGRVALITLNRPNALNALNAALIDELGDAVIAYDADVLVMHLGMSGSFRIEAEDGQAIAGHY
jgi:enoyl-CoA hydratase